jgi:aldoxime dehydratase
VAESAIPAHLQRPRVRTAGVPDDYEPPYPSFSARYRPSVTQVVMAYFGVQWRGPRPAAVDLALDRLWSDLQTSGAGHRDNASYVDEAGCATRLTVAYWDSTADFEAWFDARGRLWTDPANLPDGVGFFTEILRPTVDRYETLFSASDRLEGVGVLAPAISGPIQQHAYWGGARDRIPLSQTDPMAPGGVPVIDVDGPLRRVRPAENICLIRSGQDWTDTEADERQLYLRDVEPVLRVGMDFLRDQGLDIGCYANRYVTVLNEDGTPSARSYGMSWWKSLAALERWSESHPTHVAIFGAAMKYLSALGPNARLKLYHEVTVAAAAQQSFEYLNCHDATGLLRASRQPAQLQRS